MPANPVPVPVSDLRPNHGRRSAFQRGGRASRRLGHRGVEPAAQKHL